MWDSWLLQLWQPLLTLAFTISTAITIFMITLPSAYSHFTPGEITDNHFSNEDKDNPDRSGYNYFLKHKNAEGRLRTDVTVQVVVLGDIGRCPRMQYHALSIASHGGKVEIVGYVDSEVHPDIQTHRFVDVVPIKPFPRQLQTSNKLLFLLLAPWKVLWQILSLYHALSYRCEATKWMLVQNPPSIPTLAVAQFVCFFRRARLVIDWHNFGYTMLAMRLGAGHPLVQLSAWYESFFSRGATAHFAVSDAMARVLKNKWDVRAATLHDRPPKYFQPLTSEQRFRFLERLPETTQYANDMKLRSSRLIVSSTSWTPDEDFSILLKALEAYSALVEQGSTLPRIIAIITGKGPQKEFYLSLIHKLNQEKRLEHVVVKTAWLSTQDYSALLGSADLGISLHTSSSGVDLPMKVVDMFGSGLPVVGWDQFEAWPELVREKDNGYGFDSAERLTELLQDLFTGDGRLLDEIRQGALKESRRRWDDEWMPIAGQLFELKP